MSRCLPWILPALLPAFLPGCKSPPAVTTPIHAGAEVEAGEEKDGDAQLIRGIERNIRHYGELLAQGKTQQAVALRLTIARGVDHDFELIRRTALEAEFHLRRNPAVKCLGFAFDKRIDARDTLLALLEDKATWIVANALSGLATLREKDTPLAPLITKASSGDAAIRTEAARALKELFLIRKTPRELTPQYFTAIERLVFMLYDKTNVAGRRQAAWALANLHHPDVLDHLVGALGDKDPIVQTGGLYGLELLGDQRALEPVLKFLDEGPTEAATAWAVKVLQKIALQGGFAKAPSDTEPLGTSARLWRKWFRARRNA